MSPVCGFSLLEVMLALLLGSLLVLGAGVLFSSTQQLYLALEGQSRLQETAQTAMDFIAGRLRSAGWMGCPVEAGAIDKTLRADWSSLPEFNIRLPFEGIAGDAVDRMTRLESRLPVSQPRKNRLSYTGTRGLKLAPKHNKKPAHGWLIAGSDVLVTRQMAIRPFVLAEPLGPEQTPTVLIDDRNRDGRRNRDDLDNFGFSRSQDPVVMINDCRQASLFRVSQIKVREGRARLISELGSGPFDNRLAHPVQSNQAYEGLTYVSAIENSILFVAPGKGKNNRQQDILSLWYREGTRTAQELVPGIERIRLVCGIDSNADGLVDRYSALDSVADFRRVLSVRVLLLVSSVDAVGYQNTHDGILRQVFSQIFRLSGVRP